MTRKNSGTETVFRNHGKRLLLLIFSIVLGLSHFAEAGEGKSLTVSAAMSLKNAFEDMAASFETRHHNVTVHLNFGASGDLARQIIAGAPVDVFASASQRDMNAVQEKSGIQGRSRIDFTGNGIVLIQPKKADTRIDSFEDLTEAAVERIALGNPQSVPAGTYGAECLKYLEVYKSLQPKLILCEHVRQVLDYTARGEVDAGLVYATDAQSRPQDVRIVARAPAGSHRPIVYPIAVVKGSPIPHLAEAFVEFVMSKEGQAILAGHGFERRGIDAVSAD
jgi:molybdate transport system substrate-binding protein